MTQESYTAQGAAFRDDGVVLVRNALDPEALRLARDAYEWSLSTMLRGYDFHKPGGYLGNIG